MSCWGWSSTQQVVSVGAEHAQNYANAKHGPLFPAQRNNTSATRVHCFVPQISPTTGLWAPFNALNVHWLSQSQVEALNEMPPLEFGGLGARTNLHNYQPNNPQLVTLQFSGHPARLSHPYSMQVRSTYKSNRALWFWRIYSTIFWDQMSGSRAIFVRGVRYSHGLKGLFLKLQTSSSKIDDHCWTSLILV